MKIQKKRRAYNEHFCNVECGAIIPLFFFSAAGGMGPIATTFYNLIIRKFVDYAAIWVSHSLLQSLIICLRGACSSGKLQLAAGNLFFFIY